MSKKEIAAFACKILGIYTIIQALNNFQLITFEISSAFRENLWGINRFMALFSATISVVMLILFALLLWFYADRISKTMVKNEHKHSYFKVTSEDFQIIAFSIIGLFVIAKAIPQLTSQTFSYWLIEKRTNFGGHMSIQTKINLIRLTVEMILGLGFLLGARGIAGIIRTVREAGFNQKESA